ncbi:hypothetical protein P0082_11585 [Candidatus Haliotispira prima]|uniref:Uncharacterized protein n=1 Tax=Candidatus Haliotispira prima TaxID=3034016 RepID=A0ABY8MGI1_9SPIO|nr:hypothetical protein P0082_11585 [Candidatus Haliotispira prima]
MTDVDGDTETKFGVSASTTFVGATQALVSLTPSKSGAAAFLAVADTETIPSVTAAETLLAYREIDFSGTSSQIIQFALSISATQDATSGEVWGDTLAVLQPSTAYKVVMYSSGSSTTLLTFTTFAGIDAGHPIPLGGRIFTFNLSEHNYRTGTDGRFQVPFVFSWVMSSDLLIEVGEVSVQTVMGQFASGTITLDSKYTGLVNTWGDQARGALVLHTPRSGSVRKYSLGLTNKGGDTLAILYKSIGK